MGTEADGPPWYLDFAAVETTEESGLYRALADERRRLVLAVLRERDAPVSESELARFVAAREAEDSPNATTPADRERVQLTLHHVHLPHLEAAGLVERTDDDHLGCARHPLWNTASVRTLLTRDDGASDATTRAFDVLADDRRRATLTLLKERQELSVRELAERLAETSSWGMESPRWTTELVHLHLPKLTDAGVVEVDSTGDTVRYRYTGNVALEEWFGEVMSLEA